MTNLAFSVFTAHLSIAALLRTPCACPSHRNSAFLALRRSPAAFTAAATPSRRTNTLLPLPPSPSPAEPRPTSHPPHPAPNVARSHPRSPRRILDSLRRATSLAAAAAAASLPWHASLKIHSAARVLRRDKASTPAATNPRRWCLRRALSRQDHKHLDRRSADNLRAAAADATSAARGLARRRFPKLQARTARDRRSALILAAAMEARRRARAASLRVLSARAARRRSLPLRNAWAAARESRDARALLSRRWPSAACCRRALSEA